MNDIRHGLLATAFALTSLSGCAVATSGQSPQAFFAVGQAATAVEVAAHPVPVGELRVSFGDLLGRLRKRHVLASFADVDHVIVTVTPSTGAPVTQAIAKFAITSGQTTATFSGLPIGEAKVDVVVFDASGASIGTTSQTASVAADQVASVDLTVMLAPTVADNHSGGGSSTPSTGGLSTNIYVQDGPVVQDLPGGGKVETIKLPGNPLQAATDSTGAVWLTAAYPASGEVGLMKLSPSGQIIKRITSSSTLGPSIAIDAHDHLWLLSGDAKAPAVFEFDTEGAPVATHPVPADWRSAYVDHMRVSSTGRVIGYEPSSRSFIWWQPDGTTGSMFLWGTTIGFGLQNDVWVGNMFEEMATPTPYVGHYSETGEELGRFSLGTNYRSAYAKSDAQGNVFVTGYPVQTQTPSPGKLVKLSPSGVQLASTSLSSAPAANQVDISSDGTVWVLSGGGADGTVTWLDGAAQEKGHVALPAMNPWQFAVGVDCAWVIDTFHQSIIKVTHSTM